MAPSTRLSRYIEESKAIRFEGDNYTEEWAKEAAKRKLSNVKDSAHALDFLKPTKRLNSLLVVASLMR